MLISVLSARRWTIALITVYTMTFGPALGCRPDGKPGPFEDPTEISRSQSGRLVVRHYHRRSTSGAGELFVSLEVDGRRVGGPPGPFAPRHASLCEAPGIDAVAVTQGTAVWIIQYAGDRRIETQLCAESGGLSRWVGATYTDLPCGKGYDAVAVAHTR